MTQQMPKKMDAPGQFTTHSEKASPLSAQYPDQKQLLRKPSVCAAAIACMHRRVSRAGVCAPLPALNWLIMVMSPAAQLPTTGGPVNVQPARPTIAAEKMKNQVHLHSISYQIYYA